MSRVPEPVKAPTVRRWAAGLAALAVAVGLLALTPTATFTVPFDYYQYWSVGWLVAHGENPYDPARLHELQRAAGMAAGVPVISWHPPWTLAVTLPFGQLPVPTGFLLWTLLQAAAVFVSADLLWRSSGGPADRRWVGWMLAAGFAPTLFFIGVGQILGLCLFGVAGFTAAMRAGRPGLAGVAVALTAIKPHLLALFGLALLLQALRDRSARTAVLAGGATLAAATLAVVAADPLVLGQYLDAVLGRGPAPYRLSEVVHPTLGANLRAAVAPDSFAVQLVPLAVGAVAVVGIWWRRGKAWDWPRAVPGLVIGSLLVAPYGAWSYDLVLLLVPVVAVAARLAADPAAAPAARRVAVGWYAAVTGGLFVCLMFAGTVVLERHFVVVTPVVALGVVAVAAARGPAAAVRVPA